MHVALASSFGHGTEEHRGSLESCRCCNKDLSETIAFKRDARSQPDHYPSLRNGQGEPASSCLSSDVLPVRMTC